METKLLTVEISESLRTKLKIKATKEGKTIKAAITDLIESYVTED